MESVRGAKPSSRRSLRYKHSLLNEQNILESRYYITTLDDNSYFYLNIITLVFQRVDIYIAFCIAIHNRFLPCKDLVIVLRSRVASCMRLISTLSIKLSFCVNCSSSFRVVRFSCYNKEFRMVYKI